MTTPELTTYTPRLGLTVHSMDDELDAMRQNWDKLDTSYTGVIWVTPGTIPDSKILYEGAIVAERETGKVWRAQKNISGVFERKWIKYPWLFVGSTTNFSFPNNPTLSTPGPFGCVNTDLTQCVNSGEFDNPGSSITLPMTGIYSGVISCRFEPNNGVGQRMVSLIIGGANDNNNYVVFKMPNNNWSNQSDHVIPFNRKFNAGTTVILDVKQNSGGNVNVSAKFMIALVRPL